LLHRHHTQRAQRHALSQIQTIKTGRQGALIDTERRRQHATEGTAGGMFTQRGKRDQLAGHVCVNETIAGRAQDRIRLMCKPTLSDDGGAGVNAARRCRR